MIDGREVANDLSFEKTGIISRDERKIIFLKHLEVLFKRFLNFTNFKVFSYFWLKKKLKIILNFF